MSFMRAIDGPEPDRSQPVGPAGGHEELRRTKRSRTLGSGTLACARCDAPVALAGATLSVTAPLSCPFCLHSGRVRDFLSLSAAPRPARVRVRVVAGALARRRSRG